ncbi:MAG: Phosphomethylpyrimidine synthase [Promethearchaeota archaeon]|nr:MAG: Phosphomethylpyrimidine synthase [Candidatus Lokiarchaeota archaeon]
MTILEDAKKNKSNESIRIVCQKEKVERDKLNKAIAKGKVVIVKNHNGDPLGIGFPLRTKINVNLGTSASEINLENEFKKISIVQNYGADTISDLSMGGKIDEIREYFIKNSHLPITTVPIYQAIVEIESKEKSPSNVKSFEDDVSPDFTEDYIFKVIEKQINDGISSLVIHAGFTLEECKRFKGKRIMGMVSKGGSLTALVMNKHNIENPFLKNYDYLLDLLKEKDVVLNLGNAMRSGCIHDKIDEFQINEMKLNSKLAKKANERGVQVIIESLGGHISINQLIKWIKLHKRITNDRPLFVSGPLPVDKGVGYDHISAAIGGAFASGLGADYLCAITPAEHLKLPTPEDIKEGLIACKLAAHTGDSMKFGLNHLFDDDLELSKNRFLKNWKEQVKFSIDPEKFLKQHPSSQKDCTMCGKYCALEFSKKYFRDL